MGFLGLLGSILGGIGSGQAQGRQNQNNAINDANRNQIGLYGIQQGAANNTYGTLQQALMQMLQNQEFGAMNRAGLDLNRRQFALDAPTVRGRQALLGSLMQNLQPARISGGSPQMHARMPQISGGLSPEAIGPIARAMGLRMQQDALAGQQRGDTFKDVPQTDFHSGVVDPSRFMLPAPQMQQLKSPGLLEQIMSGAGMGSSILGAILNQNAQSYNPNNQMPSPYTGTDQYGNQARWQLPKGVLS